MAENIPIHEDQVFFYTVAEISGKDLEKLGFSLDDSIDLSISNGKTFTDVPYHNGYYVKVGGLVAVAYPGIPGISIAHNLGNGTFKEFELSEDDSVTITLHEKEKYLKEQELFSQNHSNDPNDFSSIRKMGMISMRWIMHRNQESTAETQGLRTHRLMRSSRR